MMNDEIYTLLLAELEETKRAHSTARENFWKAAETPRILPRLPTGLPQATGGDAIRKAVYEENSARQAHVEALIRLNRYLLDGTIPEDVTEKLGRVRTAR